jgi:dUTP pyrophosphatase
LPAYAHGPTEDAGLDLMYCGDEPLVFPTRQWRTCATGIAIELPPGFEGQIRPRSGLALERGLAVLNAPGTIDPGYRGEVQVLLVNLSDSEQKVEPGERIAQLVIARYAEVLVKECEALSDSTRSADGFGSTGR